MRRDSGETRSREVAFQRGIPGCVVRHATENLVDAGSIPGDRNVLKSGENGWMTSLKRTLPQNTVLIYQQPWDVQRVVYPSNIHMH